MAAADQSATPAMSKVKVRRCRTTLTSTAYIRIIDVGRG